MVFVASSLRFFSFERWFSDILMPFHKSNWELPEKSMLWSELKFLRYTGSRRSCEHSSTSILLSTDKWTCHWTMLNSFECECQTEMMNFISCWWKMVIENTSTVYLIEFRSFIFQQIGSFLLDFSSFLLAKLLLKLISFRSRNSFQMNRKFINFQQIIFY